MSETRRDQDHAQTLRELATDYDRPNDERDALRAGAASLDRTCSTCRHLNTTWGQDQAMYEGAFCDYPTASPTQGALVPADFGCTLYQPQEPAK